MDCNRRHRPPYLMNCAPVKSYHWLIVTSAPTGVHFSIVLHQRWQSMTRIATHLLGLCATMAFGVRWQSMTRIASHLLGLCATMTFGVIVFTCSTSLKPGSYLLRMFHSQEGEGVLIVASPKLSMKYEPGFRLVQFG